MVRVNEGVSDTGLSHSTFVMTFFCVLFQSQNKAVFVSPRYPVHNYIINVYTTCKCVFNVLMINICFVDSYNGIKVPENASG